MKLLVIGGNGMAGHVLVQYFRKVEGVTVLHTTRRAEDHDGITLDASDFEQVLAVVTAHRPAVIVNAVGVLNADAEQHPLAAYRVNALLPHWLRHAADTVGARLIHISSDCVFSGRAGLYTEQDTPDNPSVYGRTKAIGEVTDPRHLTIRTSIIGPDDNPSGIGLLQWFLLQTGTVRGYSRVYWNGVTTLELAKAVHYALRHPQIGGLVHLAAPEVVSKLELLQLFQAAFGHYEAVITPTEEPVIDRTLQPTRVDWSYEAPFYRQMLSELAAWMRST
ncbi:dTDP-4-dehydrorhamnose reductase [Paenibacillus cellulosilyticus]|uniref:dTDP-4-dehydrorhamnose reductase n=1 Tax=Paenibacillus cellulosilyticus TaxID=375489 RepID=A0A2V2Z2K0_9BACL|nr:SDR family oxidoreductase [Paenibacillus cellulosilyticus]PWW07345.1 dTDP-4-dehydrorhamnose reductase [Paenibacillus cellulosilyticus]QKS44477.1 SDR family oxidoreductase [Paenibacillus cellulosilyticus]